MTWGTALETALQTQPTTQSRTVGAASDDTVEQLVGGKIERLREIRARRARLDAEELALLAEIATAVDDDRGVAEELTPVLRVSTREV
ncbi:hypothetical protein LY13_002884, partial [Prauserella aidingensis]|uniref:hypothetical protein n=1 Tax=Prauserella aidingensis TaxID=387890 RepID=UPI0020A5C873